VLSGIALAGATGVIVGLTIGSAMGPMGYLGAPNTQLNSYLYFLFLDLGVGDAFVLAVAVGRHTTWYPEVFIAERVPGTTCFGGESVLIASATDALAFLLGPTTVLPAPGWSCTRAGGACCGAMRRGSRHWRSRPPLCPAVHISQGGACWQPCGEDLGIRGAGPLSALLCISVREGPAHVQLAVRLLRVLRFIGELRLLVLCILGSMRAFLWTMLLLFIVLYIFGVYFTQLVQNHRSETGELNSTLDKYYGTLGSTVLGLFQSVTGGLDWETMSTPLMREVTPLLAVMFVFFISFTTLAVLNLVTGVFVESALLRAKEDKDLCIVSQARMLFKTMDDDFHSSGEISWSKFAAHLTSAEMKSFFDSMEIDISYAQSVF